MATNTLLRKYAGTDANLLSEANLNLTLLNANLAAFTNEDETVDAAFAAAYATDITEAEETVSDEVVKAILKGKSTLVKAAQKAAAKTVKQLRYYVQEAYPTDVEVQSEFGLDKWDKARDNQDDTLRFLTAAHAAGVKYQAALTLKGYGPTRTTAIGTTRQLLEDVNNDQEEYKSGIPKLSALRVTEFNEVYERMARINKLAQIVFADDAEMAGQFVFDPAGSGGDDGTAYTGEVMPGSQAIIATVEYNDAGSISFENTGITSLTFWLNINAGENAATPLEVAAGQIAIRTMAALNIDATATSLEVQNMDEAVGAYRVEVG